MKLSIAIDMGAKNNGVFVVKSDGNRIVQKKATTMLYCVSLKQNKL
jgi:hypothetical protein